MQNQLYTIYYFSPPRDRSAASLWLVTMEHFANVYMHLAIYKSLSPFTFLI